MSNIEFLTLVGDVRKRLVSNASTVDFLSLKVGASALEIKEVTGNFDFAGKVLTNIAEPVLGSDAASKTYVDNVAIGLNVHAAVAFATTANLVVTPSGTKVGKKLTATVNGAIQIDSATLFPALTDRILVKNQLLPVNNGIYTVTALGDSTHPYELTRATDFDGSPANEVSGGDFVFVQAGDVNSHTGWIVTNDGIVDVDVDPLSWTIFSAAGTIVAGAGITQSGQTFDVVAADNSIKVNAHDLQVQLSDVGAISINNTAGHLGLKINVDGSTLEIATDALQVKALGINTAHLTDGAVTALKLASDVAGAAIGLHAITNSIDVLVDGSTLEIAGTGHGSVQIKDSGVVAVKIGAGAVTAAKLNADVAGQGLGLNITTNALDINVDGVSIEIATDAVQVKDLGITTAKLAATSVTKAKINADVAGAGLGQNLDGSLEVNTGDAIKIASDAVAVDFAVSKQNDNGSAITASKIVYVKSNGNVDLAIASFSNLNDYELGIVEDASIAAGQLGKIVTRRGAIVAGFTGLTPGKKLYVSRSTAGAWSHDLTGFVVGEFVYSVGRATDTSHVAYNPIFEFQY